MADEQVKTVEKIEEILEDVKETIEEVSEKTEETVEKVEKDIIGECVNKLKTIINSEENDLTTVDGITAYSKSIIDILNVIESKKFDMKLDVFVARDDVVYPGKSNYFKKVFDVIKKDKELFVTTMQFIAMCGKNPKTFKMYLEGIILPNIKDKCDVSIPELDRRAKEIAEFMTKMQEVARDNI